MIIYVRSKSKLSKKQRQRLTESKRKQKQIKESIKSEFKELKEVKPSSYRPNLTPSLQSNKGTANKSDKKEYTGNLIIGICQTHKSNLIPVISKDQIESITKMRR